MYDRPLFARKDELLFKSLDIGDEVFFNVYENHGIGSMIHESRDEAKRFSASKCIYRIRVIKRKQIKKGAFRS
jgi:hypothetical protein